MVEDENSIENIWEQSRSVFRDKNVLKVSYTPDKLSDALHRKEIIKRYQQYLIDVSRGLAPDNIFVFGTSGTGKSLVTRLVLKDLVRVADKKGVNVNVININCETLRTENAMWIEINNKMLEINNIVNKNVLWNSRSRHAVFFQDLFNKLEGILIIVLDEIDKSYDYNIVNKLVRSISEYNNQSPCLICITNDVNFQNCLEAHALSVLAQNEIQIDPYNAEELNDILKARVKIAFCPNTVNNVVIQLCAALAASIHGDCRMAISLLSKAGEIADERSKGIVEEEDVRLANERLEIDRILEVVKTLPTQSKLTLLSCIYTHEYTNTVCLTGNIYNVYRKLCLELDVDILTQRRISDLITELDMLGIVNAIVVSKGRYGRTKEVALDTNWKFVKQICLDDYRLKSLKDFRIRSVFETFGLK